MGEMSSSNGVLGTILEIYSRDSYNIALWISFNFMLDTCTELPLLELKSPSLSQQGVDSTMHLLRTTQRLQGVLERYCQSPATVDINQLQECLQAVNPASIYQLLLQVRHGGNTVLHVAACSYDLQVTRCILDSVSECERRQLLMVHNANGSTVLDDDTGSKCIRQLEKREKTHRYLVKRKAKGSEVTGDGRPPGEQGELLVLRLQVQQLNYTIKKKTEQLEECRARTVEYYRRVAATRAEVHELKLIGGHQRSERKRQQPMSHHSNRKSAR